MSSQETGKISPNFAIPTMDDATPMISEQANLDLAKTLQKVEIVQEPKPAPNAAAGASMFTFVKGEDVEHALATETLSHRLWRTLSYYAGVPQPLGTADYNRLLKIHGTQENITKTFSTYPDKTFIGHVLHANCPPFDLYGLIKLSHPGFMFISLCVYFLLLSSLFSALASWADCFPVPVTPGNFILLGFRIISGMGNIESFASECLAVDCFGVLIGVYISLPIFGAVVLVRLLDNAVKSVAISEHVILTMRQGTPFAMVRVMNETGHFAYNLHFQLVVMEKCKDDYLGTGFARFLPVEMTFMPYATFLPMNVSHECTEDSPLIKHNIVVIDKFGLPKWNFDKIAGVTLIASMDSEMGGRNTTTTRMFNDPQHHLIHANDKGQLPVWRDAVIANPYSWRTSRGEKQCMSDRRMLDQFEYHPREFIPGGFKLPSKDD